MLDDSLAAVLAELERNLRRFSDADADADARRPLQVAVLIMGGHEPDEIQSTLQLSSDQYDATLGQLREALTATM